MKRVKKEKLRLVRNLSRHLGIFLAILCLGSIQTTGFAQSKSISGKVTSTNGELLPGVSVVVKGTTNGVVTNIDGEFNMSVNSQDVLILSFIGMSSQEIQVADKTTFNVVLKESTEMLDEVVVTGYGGKQKRSKLTNSIATVKEETLTSGTFANPAQALSGAVSGLRVVQTSGKPGGAPSITLRGGTNFNGTGSPLVLVDGQVGTMNDVNPNDIASMEVLKDAGATALYGARANNGVILITTKTGGPPLVTLDVKFGLEKLNPTDEFLGAEDYLYWVRTGYHNASRMYQDSNGDWQGYNPATSLSAAQPYGTGNKYFDTDGTTPLDGNQSSQAYWSTMLYTPELEFLLDEGWQTMIDPVTGKEIIFSEFVRESTAFNDPALTQDYNVSFSGGHEKGKYYAGVGYYEAEGLPVQTWYKRFNLTFNAEYRVKRWLTSYSNFKFTDAKWDDGNKGGNYFGRMLSAPPTQREYNPDGELILGKNVSDGNPLVSIDKFIYDNNTNRFNMGQSFKVNLIENLNVKLSAAWLIDQTTEEYFEKDYLKSPGNISTTRKSEAGYDKSLSQTYNAVITYKRKFNKHSADALIGYEFFDKSIIGFHMSGSGAPTDDFKDLGFTSTEEGKRYINSNHSQERIRSYFGKVNYDYNEKYLLSGTFRSDGYSRLLGDNRWGFFPGVSAGWLLSKEDFMKDYDHIISFLKVRGSYGLNGNVSGIGRYELQGSYNSTTYDGSTGYRVGDIPNEGLKWERSKTFELGIDVSFLENKINTNFTYYNRLTMDKYAYIPLPISSGISGVRSNNGELKNKGIEIDLTAKVLRKGNWIWDITANISHNVNVVEKLPANGLEKNRQNAFQVYDENSGELKWVGGYQEGETPGDMYAFEALGIFQSMEEIAEVANNRVDATKTMFGSSAKPVYGPQAWADLGDDKGDGFPIQPGDVNWRDVNGDGVIDNYDKVKVGNTTPKWFGGFSSTLKYRGFKFYARMDYSLGFQQFDNQRPWFMAMAQGTYNSIVETKDSWTPENPDAKYPTYRWADQLGVRNYARTSSMWVYDGSYLAFREVSLSYTLPETLLDNLGLKTVTFSVTGQNLGYLTASELNRPEVSGSVSAGYSLPKKVIFGANIKF